MTYALLQEAAHAAGDAELDRLVQHRQQLAIKAEQAALREEEADRHRRNLPDAITARVAQTAADGLV